MENNACLFKICHTKRAIFFENYSHDTLCVYQKPIKPKRKFNLIAIVAPNSFVIWDLTIQGQIDITVLMFNLEKR